MIISNPVEECHMEPIKTCKMVTKLVPGLKPVQECVDVPKEICATNKEINLTLSLYYYYHYYYYQYLLLSGQPSPCEEAVHHEVVLHSL